MPESDTYELLTHAANVCDTALPVNAIRDEYTLVRVTPLMLENNGSSGQAVLPRDVVHPELMKDVHLKIFPDLPYKVGVPELRGGLPLHSKWKKVLEPPAGPATDPTGIKEVKIGDLQDFVSNPTIEIGGETVRASLDEHNVIELLGTGTSIVRAPRENGDGWLRVTLKGGAPGAGSVVHRADPVASLGGLLLEPELRVESEGSYHVELTEQNIEELSRLGVSKVTASREGMRFGIYVTAGKDGPGAGDSPVVHGAGTGVASSASAMTMTMLPAVQPAGTSMPASNQVVEQTISQLVLPSFEFVFYLPYRQTWELLGYSRGELLNSVSLAPQEETTIEIFTWDRLKTSQEDTSEVTQEATLDISFTDKVSLEVLKETSNQFDWKVDQHGDVSIPIKMVQLNLGHDVELKNSLKELNRSTQQSVSEAVRKASSHFKATRQTKVSESRETGIESRTTRKLKNANMCHTLNLDYFEVLATYRVTTRLLPDRARLCLLTPHFVPDRIDRQFLLTYEGPLREALLSSKAYAPGFDAAKKLAAWERVCDVKCAAPCPCDVKPLPAASGTPADTGATVDPGKAALDQAVADMTRAAGSLRNVVGTLQGGGVEPICKLANDLVRWGRSIAPEFLGGMSKSEKDAYEKEWQDAKTTYHRWLYRKGLESVEPRFWSAVLDFKNGNDNSPEALERLVDAGGVHAVDVINVVLLLPKMQGAILGVIIDLVRGMCVNVKPLFDNVDLDDAGFDATFKQLRTAVDAWRTAKAAPKATTGSGDAKKDETQQVLDDTKKEAAPEYTVKEIVEAQVAEGQLLAHIRANESYYRQAIWSRLDPNDRLVYLSKLGNLMRYVDNEVLGFVGDKAVLPFRLETNADLAKWFAKYVATNKDLTDETSQETVTLPTRGVVMDSRLGQCDACEDFIADHRKLDLAQKQAEVDAAKQRAAQEELETKRYEERLAKELLDDPDPNQNGRQAVHVVLEKPE